MSKDWYVFACLCVYNELLINYMCTVQSLVLKNSASSVINPVTW